MRILVINPNRSTVCSDRIHAAALRAAQGQLEVRTLTAASGPAYIETGADEIVAAKAVLEILEAELARPAQERPQGAVVACSSDPGVKEARLLYEVPIVGIGEAAFLLCRGLGRPYAILTNVEEDEPVLRRMAVGLALDGTLVSVRAAGSSVESFDKEEPAASQGLRAAARRAVRDDGAEALCLACAAMAGLETLLEDDLGVPVFEGVAAGISLVSIYAGRCNRSLALPKHSGSM